MIFNRSFPSSAKFAMLLALTFLLFCISDAFIFNFSLNKFKLLDFISAKGGKLVSHLNFIASSKLKDDYSQMVEKQKDYKIPYAEDVTIRFANYHDIAGVVNLRVSVFYPMITEKILKRMRESNSKVLTIQRNKFGEIIESGGAFFGNTIGTVEYSPGDFKETAFEQCGSPNKVYVGDLCIREDARNMGLATRLIAQVEDICIKEGYDEIYLHVNADNVAARNLYKKLGFIELSGNDVRVRLFTEERLQKPADDFVFLKRIVSKAFPLSSSPLVTAKWNKPLSDLRPSVSNSIPSSPFRTTSFVMNDDDDDDGDYVSYAIHTRCDTLASPSAAAIAKVASKPMQSQY